jgi:hypothetical protein
MRAASVVYRRRLDGVAAGAPDAEYGSLLEASAVASADPNVREPRLSS